MAEVTSRPSKQKMSLNGFLESHQGESNTHQARKEQGGIPVKPKKKLQVPDELGNRSDHKPKKKPADKLGNTTSDHNKPKVKRSSSAKKSREPLLLSQSAHVKTISKKEAAPEVEGDVKKAAPKPRRRGPPSRSKSFNMDGIMSAEGAGSAAAKIGSKDDDATGGRTLPTRSQSSCNPSQSQASSKRTSTTNNRKSLSRSKSYDGEKLPLKRIPRNPQRGIMLEKQPSQRGMLPRNSLSQTGESSKKRRSGKKPERTLPRKTTSKDKSGDGSDHCKEEKQQPKQELSLEAALAARPVASTMTINTDRDTDAFTVDFPDSNIDAADENPSAFEFPAMPASATSVLAPPSPTSKTAEQVAPKKLLIMTSAAEDDSDSDEDENYELGGDGGEAAAGIIQFDPTASDNVTLVRENTDDQFPTDFGAIDMGLGVSDHDAGSTHHNEDLAAGKSAAADTSTIAGQASAMFAKTGRGFFQSKLIKPGSFKFNKKSAGTPVADLDMTNATAAVGAAVANLTKGWSTSGQQHQQLDDGDDEM